MRNARIQEIGSVEEIRMFREGWGGNVTHITVTRQSWAIAGKIAGRYRKRTE